MNFKKFIFSVLLCLNILLLYFVLFEDKLVIPSWLQVAGRMHPLFLHFPIVLALIVAAATMGAPAPSSNFKSWYTQTLTLFLSIAALTAALTAIMGLFLSLSNDYDTEISGLHKWAGVSLSFLLLALYIFREETFKRRFLSRISGIFISATVIIAGHFGAALTHGEDFILEPIVAQSKEILPPFDDAMLFAHLVQPILKNKCLSCHNSKKAKGKLIMETQEAVLKGGKGGKIWDSTKPHFGLLMQRIHLPETEKKHMPPAGKPQLTEQEVETLAGWLRLGPELEKKISELPMSDTIYQIAKKIFGASREQVYTFQAADDKTINRLNNINRLVAPIASGSPALRVSFFNRELFDRSMIEELQPVRGNITEINLVNMPVRDEDLQMLKPFKNLRKLNLNNTLITGKTLAELADLPALHNLSLSGTAVQSENIKGLASFKSIKNIYLWNTAVSEADVKGVIVNNKQAVFHLGYKGDTTTLKLNPPVFKNEQDIISAETLPLMLQHYINGAAIRYTLDGTDPDSVHSPVFDGKLLLNANALVRAKAFKAGWFSSDIAERYFFKSSFRPDSAVLLTTTKPPYKAKGAKTLIDLEKSDANFSSGKWLGFQMNDLECLLLFNKPVTVSNVTLSILLDIRAYIFPPQLVQVWGGNDERNLKLLHTIHPRQPKRFEDKGTKALDCNFKPVSLKVIRIVAKPLAIVPPILQDMKLPGHIFIDEVFVN